MITHVARTLLGFPNTSTVDLTDTPLKDITPARVLAHAQDGVRRIVMTQRQVTELRQQVMAEANAHERASFSSEPPAGALPPPGAVAEVAGAWIVERP